MKVYHVITIAALFMAVLMTVMTGCKYDVAQPLWFQPYTAPPTPTITQVNPAQALGGANTITIAGTNFAVAPDTNLVYFNNIMAEIVSASGTAITVRRPNLVSDSCTVKLVSPKALVVAKFSPYKISSVFERYGGFFTNVQLNVVVADQAGNLIVVKGDTSRGIIKVTPDGQQTVIGKSTRNPFDGKIGPDGRLYLVESNRSVDVVDLNTGIASQWLQLPSGKLPRLCDFDVNGYCYVGGSKSDVITIAPDLTVTSLGVYAKDDIYGLRVYNGYLYVAIKTASPSATNPATAIWRHSIAAGGVLGTKELVLDWTQTPYASRTIKVITFASNGVMYIGTDASDPIVMFDPASQTTDLLYKSILPSYCKQLYWSTGNYFYMISGNTTPAQEWTIYRVDAGVTGAPYSPYH